MLLFYFSIVRVFSQSAFPTVTVTPSNSSICSGCTTLTATIQGSVETSSYSVSKIIYNPFSFTGPNKILVNKDDTMSDAIKLPFCFQFFGKTYDYFIIGANQVVSFDTSLANGRCEYMLTTDTVPAPGPGLPTKSMSLIPASIFAPIEDLDPSIVGTISYAVYGTSPARTMVISWDMIPLYSNICSDSICSSQVVLYETTNIIDINIKMKASCPSWNGGLAIEGIQDETCTKAYTVPGRNNTVWNVKNDAYRFTPTGVPQYSVTWYEPPNNAIGTANTITVCPTTTTTYTAVVTNNNCSTPIIVTDVGTVSIGAGATFSLTSTPASCSAADGSATASVTSGTGPFTYTWSTTPVQNTATATGLAPGIYSVTVTYPSCTTVKTVTVTTAGGLIGNATSTNASCSLKNGSATASVTGGTSPFTYTWSTTPVQHTAVATGLDAGNYSVTVTDANGCSYTDSVNVNTSPALSLTMTSTLANCSSKNGTATASPQGGTAPFTYAWSSSPPQMTQTASGLAAGTYSVLITDAGGCTATSSVTVNSASTFTSVSVTATSTKCNNTQDGTAVANPGNGTAPYSYLWSNAQTNQTATGLSSGNYSVTVTDANGCTVVSGILVSSPSGMQLSTSSLADTCSMKKGKALSSPSGGSAPYSYLWLTTPIQATQTASGLASGTYSCIITDSQGCTAISKATIANIPGPTAGFAANPPVIDIINPIISFLDLSVSDIISWQWSFGDGGTSTSQNPDYSFQQVGTYTVTLVVVNKLGCIDSVSQTVVVETSSTFYVPNAITPGNGDGNNDMFLPVYAEIETKNYDMKIFDRWGNLVFHTTDIKKGWDGKYEDNKLQEDSYVYSIKYSDLKQNEHKVIGFVNVIR